MESVDTVNPWRHSIDNESCEETQEVPTLASIYAICSDLYSDIIEALSDDDTATGPVFLSLQRSQSYLILWAESFGVPGGDLDKSVHKSRRARVSTFRLLSNISHTLTHCLLPLVSKDRLQLLSSKASNLTQATARLRTRVREDDALASESDSCSDTSSEDTTVSLGDAAEDLRVDTRSLFALGSRFKEPAVGSVEVKAVTSKHPLRLKGDQLQGSQASIFVNRLLGRFPRCNETLVQRLGKVNSERFDRYKEMINTNARLPEQSASNKDAAATQFNDSGYGTSLSATSQYAETTVSYEGGQGDSIRVPSLPAGASEGAPFRCISCGKMVTIRNKSAWKKHIFRDLRPYVCLGDRCNHNEEQFEERAKWEHHMKTEHPGSLSAKLDQCPICMERIPEGLFLRSKHLAMHLEEIALTVLPPSDTPGSNLDKASSTSSASEPPGNSKAPATTAQDSSGHIHRCPEESCDRHTDGFRSVMELYKHMEIQPNHRHPVDQDAQKTNSLRWICPHCKFGNNSWIFDNSCPNCYGQRPEKPAMYNASTGRRV